MIDKESRLAVPLAAWQRRLGLLFSLETIHVIKQNKKESRVLIVIRSLAAFPTREAVSSNIGFSVFGCSPHNVGGVTRVQTSLWIDSTPSTKSQSSPRGKLRDFLQNRAEPIRTSTLQRVEGEQCLLM